MSSLNTSISTSAATFRSPFSTFIYDAISSYSTSLGGTVLTSNNFSKTLSTLNFVSSLSTNTLNTSTLNIAGNRQPCIQYGQSTLNMGGTNIIVLSQPYKDTTFAVQLTYINSLALLTTTPISAVVTNSSTFNVYGIPNIPFYWTTYGNLF